MAASDLTEIEALLAEPVAVAARRERAAFAELLGGTDGTVVLFGAGRLGRLCARALRRAGVPLRAFCDGNPLLQGAAAEGVEIMSPADAARRFGTALFVVAIWTGTARESMRERVAFLEGLGCTSVSSYVTLVWAHGGEEAPFHSFDLPSRTLRAAPHLLEVASRLGDTESIRVFLAALKQRLLGFFDSEPPAPDQYFPAALIKLGESELFVDGGAFDGDTLEEFLRHTSAKFSRYHAFEPDGANIGRLRARIAALIPHVREKISVHQLALHSENAVLSFADQGGQTSRLNASGSVQVLGRPLDGIVGDERVTFIKLDVEGAELGALLGGKQTLRKHRPIVAACVYHGPSDLWTIPLKLLENIPESRLYLRQHGIDGWEMVCYVIPNERTPQAC